jgi:phage tail sheath gpL-like
MGRTYPNISWKSYLRTSNPNTIDYLKKYGKEFILQTFNKIKLAKRLKRKNIVLFRFRNSNIVATINKSDYQLVLSELLNLCVKLEFYEIASEIHKSLTSKRGRKPKKEVTQLVTF